MLNAQIGLDFIEVLGSLGLVLAISKVPVHDFNALSEGGGFFVGECRSGCRLFLRCFALFWTYKRVSTIYKWMAKLRTLAFLRQLLPLT